MYRHIANNLKQIFLQQKKLKNVDSLRTYGEEGLKRTRQNSWQCRKQNLPLIKNP